MSAPTSLPLHEFHQSLGASFTALNSAELVGDYGDARAEYKALYESAGVLDLSFRSRICLTGVDRARFLHGQVTNDVKKLRAGEGCYAALTTAKGKMQSDLNIFCLQDELLLDFEPGRTAPVTQRLEKYIVADDVQVVDVAPHYGLLSVQGPNAEAVVRTLALFATVPSAALASAKISNATLGEIYLVNHARLASHGFDLFVPLAALGTVADQLITAAKATGGLACGWNAFEIARVEAGIPRFGADMDETHIASECGIEARAISYTKGCYIGQEVLNRIHSIGHVNRALCRLTFAAELRTPPAPGAKLFQTDKEVGHITSAVVSPRQNCVVALGYVRREANAVGTNLLLRADSGEITATIG
ncbi:MAG: glycine cleavage T C-terminal barrel domain-containing protein [Verrucomicrobiota bacterium]